MDEGIKRMSASQYKSAKALIKNLCANYESTSGECLILGCTCPQMITQSLICRYFRDVLLEDKDGQLLKAEIFQDDHVKKCEVCGRAFRALSNRAKYCAECSLKRRTQKQRGYTASYKSRVRG